LIFNRVAPVAPGLSRHSGIEPVKPVKKGSDLLNCLLAHIAAGYSIQRTLSSGKPMGGVIFWLKDAFGVSVQMGGALVKYWNYI